MNIRNIVFSFSALFSLFSLTSTTHANNPINSVQSVLFGFVVGNVTGKSTAWITTKLLDLSLDTAKHASASNKNNALLTLHIIGRLMMHIGAKWYCEPLVRTDTINWIEEKLEKRGIILNKQLTNNVASIFSWLAWISEPMDSEVKYIQALPL